VSESRRRRRRWAWGVAVLACVAVAGLMAAEYVRRNGLYWYDVRQDAADTFGGPGSRRLQVALDEAGFELQQVGQEWDTALLRVELRANLSGRWFEPSIEIEQEGRSLGRQFFERGVRGARWLDLPVPAVGRVSLKGRHLGWRAQVADLVLFANPSPCGRPVLVVAPHPDDAEIAAFGLYSCALATVVTVSAGESVDGRYAHLAPDAAAQQELRGEVRVWDSVAVPRWGGVPAERAINLGFFNGTLEEMRADPDVEVKQRLTGSTDIARYRRWNSSPLLDGRPPPRPTWRNLVGDLAHLVDAAAPEIVVAPHPELDASADHRATTWALLDALEITEHRPQRFLLFTNHAVGAEYFPFGPAGARYGVPPWFETPAVPWDVYSHPLDEHDQRDKLIALEAMHDLRPAPREVRGGPAAQALGRLTRAVGEVVFDPFVSYSYLRRGVRANELFLVLSPEAAMELTVRAGAQGLP
jgi:LmbE family N-acetylglucosaminyl deacetylase